MNKIVEKYRPSSETVEFRDDRVDGVLCEAVTKCGESVGKLAFVDVPRTVAIERPEAVLPIGHVAPKRTEIVEINLPFFLLIEHS